MESMKHKQTRLAGFDYSTPGVYFVTICTNQRRFLFWEKSDAIVSNINDIQLSELGYFVNRTILNIPVVYPNVSVDHYVIMPNHVHLLLRISKNISDTRVVSISSIIKQMKRLVTKHAGFPVWQKDFYDHIIRDEEDYKVRWNYIEGNPSRWKEDEICRQIACDEIHTTP